MPFSPKGHRKLDFPRLCASRLRTGTEVVGVVDQRITPVFLDDCVEALAVLIEQRAPGVWHVAATDWTTPFDFARAVARNLHLNASLIVEDRFERFASFRPAPRPRDSWLNVSKFEREFGTGVLRSVEEELAAWAARLMRSRSVPSST
jgi:dTDP-4-dehydrorhamnose reductase